MEDLLNVFAKKLGLDDSKEVKVLDDVSVDGIVELIKEGKCKNIITLAGAGISTAAGIPDFRSPETGLYNNLQKYNLPYPEAIFQLNYFHENPKPFYELAKELYPGNLLPTISHYFVKLLENKGVLIRHYTQNIDTLERIAQVTDEKIVEAHGTFHFSHCTKCRKEYSNTWMKAKIFNDEIPICEECSGVIKPDIIFFGEALPDKFHKSIKTDFKKCDLLIIMGSSLEVQPFASLVARVPKTCPRLLINREKVGSFTGLNFDDEDNTRDVAWLGNCDDGCQMLADKLGWGEELKEMHKIGHELLKENATDDDKMKKNKPMPKIDNKKEKIEKAEKIKKEKMIEKEKKIENAKQIEEKQIGKEKQTEKEKKTEIVKQVEKEE